MGQTEQRTSKPRFNRDSLHEKSNFLSEISTKDIDISFWKKEDLEEFKNTLERLGYRRKSHDDILVYERDRTSRIDIYYGKAGKINLTMEMISRAHSRQYGNLTLYIASDTDLLLQKMTSGRPRDYEDTKKIIRGGNIDWKKLIDELLEQEKQLKTHYCLRVYLTLSEIAREEKMHIPYLRKLARITTEHMVRVAYEVWGLKQPKDIKKIIDVSEETIRRILKKIKSENKRATSK